MMIWNAQQQQQRTLCGNCYDTRYLDFVCVDQLGTLIQPDYVTSKFAQILNKYGLRPIRFRDLRHSCATIMLYLGYSLKDIQTWLGHSNYNFRVTLRGAGGTPPPAFFFFIHQPGIQTGSSLHRNLFGGHIAANNFISFLPCGKNDGIL